MRLGRDRVDHAARKARLADAGLARQQHQWPFASLCLLPPSQQQCQSMIPADHIGQLTGCAGLEPTFHNALTDDAVGQRLSRNPLQILATKVSYVEHVAKKAACRLAQHDLVRQSDPLQARREIGRVADDGLLLRSTLSHEVADHYKASRDADAHLNFLHGPYLQRPDHAYDFQSCSDRPLRVVLMGVWKAEIGENAVAHEFSEEAVVACDNTRAGVLIAPNHMPHILGIKSRRQGG